MKKIILGIISILIGTVGYSQCVENTAFKSGEQLQYTGYFHWGFIWVNAGTVKINTQERKINDKDVFEVTGVARNANAFSVFFKLRDSLTTHLDKKGLKPLYLDRRTHEGKYKARHVYSYAYDNSTIYAHITKRNAPTQHSEISFTGCNNNIISILPYVRNLDYDSFKKGQIIPLKMIVDGEISNVEVRYHGTDIVKTRHDREFEAYKITPVLPDGTMFKGGDDMIIWFSKDKNRVPIMIEAKIPVGSVKGILENYSGLRYEDNVFGNTEGTFEKAKQ